MIPTVVIATTKVRIFKQITTDTSSALIPQRLLLLPQRYVFSSKSQPAGAEYVRFCSCYCYHKGTYFQANHNFVSHEVDYKKLLLLPQRYVFSSKSQRYRGSSLKTPSCYCYHKGTYFQANHNFLLSLVLTLCVVIATTKVRIFKQITTAHSVL